jgi:hypothetical protein
MLKFITSLLLISSISLFAQSQNSDTITHKEAYKIGQKASKKLLKTLGSNLKKQIKEFNLLKAIEFCSNEAFPLTNKVNEELRKKYNGKVSVSRISDQFRNPANKPQGEERIIMETIIKMQKSGVVLPRGILQEIDPETYKFYMPLKIAKPVCLKCHGDSKNMPEEIRNYLKTNYPEDKAQNYQMNDIRGAVTVTIRK